MFSHAKSSLDRAGLLDPVSDVDGAARPAPPTRPVRIMVADDNCDAAASLATLLSLDGHEVSVAYDGKAALGSAETGTFLNDALARRRD